MPELVLVLTRFTPPADLPSGAEPERLPHLETLLSRSRRAHIGHDWRAWLAAAVAPPELLAFGLAAIAGASFRGAGVPRPESTGYWLATPVHFFAGLDSVHLHPAGLLALSREEQQALVADFGRVFADSRWRLEVIGHCELLLSGPPLDATGADPAQFLGDDPSAGLPRGAEAGALRRLGSEIEMWLHEHPINQARAAAGHLSVTALWFWGGAPPAVPQAVPRLTHATLYGTDCYAESLWRLQGRPALALSQAMQAIQSVPSSLPSASVALLASGLHELEQYWLPGALQALRQRRLTGLRLIAGTHVFATSPLQWLQFWRARRPWWEALA